MTDRYQKIRDALAMGPTPGPWRFARTNSGVFVKSERLAGYFVEVRRCRATQSVDADAYLISACDPDTIRELLAERDALAAEVERLAVVLQDLEERVRRDEALLRKVLEVLGSAHQTAMEQALMARVPECSAFAKVFQEEVERLARDAARYRWLRKVANDDIAVVRGMGAMDYGMSAVVATYSEEIDGDDLDAAIDEAMEKENSND